jgi:phage terminase large subunit
MPSLLTPEKEREVLRIIEDPALFAQIMLGHDVWTKQHEILESVATHPRTAVKACHASGKTFTAAEAVLWWITSRQEAIAVTTAPTWTQVEKLLWGEIRGAVYKAKIAYPKPTTTSLHLAPGRYAIGLSTNEGVRFQGFHGNVLIVLDEAPGILPSIYEAIEGIRAGGDVRVLALGNPTIASGPFYDAFTANREGWNLITISAFDTPNLEGITLESLLELPENELDQNSKPYLTTRSWVKEKYYEWGPGHPLWESRVLGNFPMQSEDALLALTWLEQAKLRDGGDGELCAGVDVAGPGEDETVLCLRRGPRIVMLQAWTNRDPRGDLLAALLPYKQELKKVSVDSVGIGYYMAQHMKDHGLPVTEINVGETARDSEKYSNLKAELYWGFRMRAHAGDLAGLTDERTIAQLAGIRYSHNSRGQVVIESKDDARKRGVKSPDRAEAVMLAFAELRGGELGFIEYLKQEQAEIDRNRSAMSAGSPSMLACPKCESRAIARIPNGRRCSRCGHFFGYTVNIQRSVTRGEVLRGADGFGLFGRRR